jgi:MraZ protein
VAEEKLQGAVPEEPPRGIYPARLDDKGRLRLPEKFQTYVSGLAEKKLFVTSKDRLMATVYPISIWRENENFFATYKENPDALQRLWFTNNELGSEVEMDSQGRVLFSPELRRELHLENQPVRVLVDNGAILVMSEVEFQRQRLEAAQSAGNDLRDLKRVGFK